MYPQQNIPQRKMDPLNQSQVWLPPTTSGLETELACSGRSTV